MRVIVQKWHMLMLQSLLDVRRLRLRARHLPDPDAAVRWVATSELPDPTPFLRDGEVLLTTGLEAVGWGDEWAAYVERLVRAGLAGLGFGVGLSHRSVPRALLDACREQGLALFEVPRATTFVAVSEAAAGLLQEGEAQVARDALDAHRRLARAALRDDPDELLREVAALGVAAGIAGPGGALEAGPYGDRPDLLDDPGVAATIARIRPAGLRGAGAASTSDGTVLVHPLGVSGRPGRWLLTGFDGPVDEVRRGAVNAAVALLGLAEERRRAARETARMLRSRAVELVVAGDARSAAVVLAATAQPPRLPDPLVVLRATGPAEQRQDAAEALDPLLTSGEVADELVLLVRPARAAAQADDLAGRGLWVGVGERVPLADAPRGHATAGLALGLARAEAPVASWSEHVDRGALGLVEAERAAAFGESWLAPVVAADHEGVLVETLRSFLAHHGSQVQVSADLGVHRNTVRSRVRQIEQALGRSLAEPQTRVDAWIALRSRET